MKPILLTAILAASAAVAQPAKAASPGDVIARTSAVDWMAIAPAEILLLEFEGSRRVVLQMAPQFAPSHVANIRMLVADGWFPRHARIVRVQENYVVQWGDPTGKAPLPTGIIARPPDVYERPGLPKDFAGLPYPDAYGATVGHWAGWPVASDGNSHWLPHCPGMVGVGRDMPPDTGTGAELYVVIGHGPRHLDRNIALVGRVLEGIEHLSALPRGTGALGMYQTAGEQVGMVSARLATDLAPEEQPQFEVLAGMALQEWVKARANRRDGFFIRPAGSADICNLLPPVRRSAQAK